MLPITIKNTKAGLLYKNKGFSLVELMVVLTLIGIVAGITAKMLLVGAKTFDTVSTRNETLQINRIGIELLIKDLRMIKSSNDIVSADAGRLIFYTVDGEHITYLYSAGELTRNDHLLMNGLSEFQLIYYDNDGTELSVPVTNKSDIWDIKISADATVNESPFHLETKVHPRNIQ